MLKIEKAGHEIAESERASVADLYVKVVQSISLKGIKKGIVALFIICIIFCVLLDNVEGGYPLSQTLPIGAAVCVGYSLFIWLMSKLGKVNLRKQGLM